MDPISFHPLWKISAALQAMKSAITVLPQQSLPKRIFIDRAGITSRKLLNIKNIAPILSRFGIERILPEQMSFQDQVDIFSGAEVIVGIMGAAMVNTLFARHDCAILYLAPESFIDPFYWDLADTMGVRCTVMYGDANDDSPPHLADFTIDAASLEKTLRQMIESPAPRARLEPGVVAEEGLEPPTRGL